MCEPERTENTPRIGLTLSLGQTGGPEVRSRDSITKPSDDVGSRAEGQGGSLYCCSLSVLRYCEETSGEPRTYYDDNI